MQRQSVISFHQTLSNSKTRDTDGFPPLIQMESHTNLNSEMARLELPHCCWFQMQIVIDGEACCYKPEVCFGIIMEDEEKCHWKAILEAVKGITFVELPRFPSKHYQSHNKLNRTRNIPIFSRWILLSSLTTTNDHLNWFFDPHKGTWWHFDNARCRLPLFLC